MAVHAATITGTTGNGQQATTTSSPNQLSPDITHRTSGSWLLSYWWILLIILLLIAGGLLWFLLAGQRRETEE